MPDRKTRLSLRLYFGSGALHGSIIALGAALLLSAFLIALNSETPLKTLSAFFLGPWSSPWFLGNTLDYAVLLTVSAAAVSIAFRGGAFNLGGEGQIYLGGLSAALILQGFPQVSGSISLLIAATAALTMGSAMGTLSGLLRKYAGADEMISSFLLSAGLSPIADYLISGPLRDSSGNLLAMPRLPADRILPRILSPSSLNISVIPALLIILFLYLFLSRTTVGYRFRVAGTAPNFARFNGINPLSYRVPAMSLSGAFHGLAGFFAVAGTYGLCHRAFPSGLGWNAIAVALIARNKPLAIFPAALAYGWLKSGSDIALLTSGLNFEAPSFIQGVVLLLATVQFSRLFRSRP